MRGESSVCGSVARRVLLMECGEPLKRLLFIALTLVGTTACSDPLSTAECTVLLDRYTAELLRFRDPQVSQAVIVRRQHAARELARTDPVFEFDRCAVAVSRSQFHCAMSAKDVQTMDRCLM